MTVQYGQSDYTVAEGGTLEVTVTLSEDPLQEKVIPIAATGQDGATSADYSVPSSVTFGEGDTVQDHHLRGHQRHGGRRR